MPRQKDTVSRMPAGRIASDDQSDSSRKHPRSCDVCRRSETPLVPVLVCSSCKVFYVLYWDIKIFYFLGKILMTVLLLLHEQVSVHLDCYRSKVSTGPWLCELCDDLLTSRLPGVIVCGLCGDRNGAFRKSTNGQWVHAFCAEVKLLFSDAFFLSCLSFSSCLPFCTFLQLLFKYVFSSLLGEKSSFFLFFFWVFWGGGLVGVSWSHQVPSSLV